MPSTPASRGIQTQDLMHCLARSLPSHLHSIRDFGWDGFLLNKPIGGPLVRVGVTNRDYRVLYFGLVTPTGTKGLRPLVLVENTNQD